MRQRLILLFFCFLVSFSYAQNKPGTSFDGTVKGDPNVCPGSGHFLSEKDVEDLITEMLDKIGTLNRYIIVSCPQVDNCQATVYNNRPYILYNPEFLNKVKHLNFSNASLPGTDDKDWETLTILAHELGHHINHHLDNPFPNETQPEMELEADKTAGFIIYLMGGTLSQAQLAYNNNPNITEQGSYTHPPRKQRLEAIAKGWNNAAKKYPKPISPDKPVNPSKPSENTNTVTDVDGNIYKSVKVGSQTWSAGNLNVSHFRNGDIIPEAKTDKEWEKAGNEGKPEWCYYYNDPVNGRKYGKLYNWFAVNDSRGLAPNGWHIPTTIEFADLTEYLGGENIAGGKMKYTAGWESNGNGTNESGIAGLPGGLRSLNGPFSAVGSRGFWWSSSENGTNSAWSRNLYASGIWVGRGSGTKGNGFSVRCVRD